MPTVMDIVLGNVKLDGVVGRAYRPSTRLRVSEGLDGSSLDVDKVEHLVTFAVGREFVPRVKPFVKLNDYVPFSARYSTGETIARTEVLVRNVNPLDTGDMEYTLSVNPNTAIIDEPAPG